MSRWSAAARLAVIVEKDGVKDELPADTVILATGYAAKNDLYDSLKNSGKEIYLLGDAKIPSNIMHAVADGNEAGRAI